MKEFIEGDTVEFNHVRIQRGNPVTGRVTSFNAEYITLYLHKEVEGLVTTWGRGTTKQFRREFIDSEIKVIKPKV